MAINTVANIKLAVASFLNRSDLTSLIPDFIELTQAKLNRDVRVPQMLTRDDLTTIDSQYEAVPSGWLETSRMSLLTSPQVQLEYLTPEEMDYKREYINDAGNPVYFSVVGDNFEFLPTPDSTYTATHLYYTSLDLTTTNWLLTSHPDIVLYGALCEAEPYLMNDARLPVWQSKYEQAMKSLKVSGERRQIAGTPRARIRSF